MPRRNGRGSKSLADTITQFERSELRLLRSASRAQVLSAREVERFEERFADSPSQKRSSDVLAAAIQLNKLLASALRESPNGPNGERSSPRAELEVLAEIGTALRAQAPPAEALRKFLALLGEIVPFDRAAVFVFDPGRKHLEAIAAAGGFVDLIEGVEFDFGTGFSSWVAKRRKATLLTDLQRPVRDGERPLRCFMSVPIVVHGELVGVLNLGHAEPRAFEEEHLRLVGTLAPLLAATLEREVTARRLEELAAADPLTGALTQKRLAERLLEEVDRTRRYGDPLTLLLIRVRDYTGFVAAHGLATGEAVLRTLGRLVRASVRGADPVGRVGSDELAVLLVHTDPAEAAAVGERLGAAVGRQVFPRRKRLQVDLALAAYPDGGEELHQLLAGARRRLAASSAAHGLVPSTNGGGRQAAPSNGSGSRNGSAPRGGSRGSD